MERTPRDVIARYCELFKAKYGINPPIGGKQAGIAKQLHQTYVWEHLDGLLTTYFQMHDEFIESTGHSLEVFRGCLPKVIAEWTKREKAKQRTGPQLVRCEDCKHSDGWVTNAAGEAVTRCQHRRMA